MPPTLNSRPLQWMVLLCALCGVVGFALQPVHSKWINAAWLACIAVAWASVIALLATRKRGRTVAMILPTALCIPLVLPSQQVDPDELRHDYVQRMIAFEGTTYLWGGEGPGGIDCSGLPRRALRDALFASGVANFNGQAFRAYVEQWWFDASAKAMGEGHRGHTQPLGITGTIREMPYTDLQPGDLAVTKNGKHILAYVGDGRWIQADPGVGKVVTLDGRTDDNPWFRLPVGMHRWKWLSQR